MTNRLVNINILTVLIFTSHFIGCADGRQNKKSEEADIIEVNAPGSLFNGKTLDGWEITNFGPQGPVYVSGDAIILAMGDGCTGITWKKDFPDINYEVTLEAKRE